MFRGRVRYTDPEPDGSDNRHGVVKTCRADGRDRGMFSYNETPPNLGGVRL